MITEQPNLSKIKIRAEFHPDTYYFIARNGSVKRGNYCRACGSPLKDPTSIKRGYGGRCWNDIPVIIILEIPSSDKPR
jgi:hypothetical protein